MMYEEKDMKMYHGKEEYQGDSNMVEKNAHYEHHMHEDKDQTYHQHYEEKKAGYEAIKQKKDEKHHGWKEEMTAADKANFAHGDEDMYAVGDRAMMHGDHEDGGEKGEGKGHKGKGKGKGKGARLVTAYLLDELDVSATDALEMKRITSFAKCAAETYRKVAPKGKEAGKGKGKGQGKKGKKGGEEEKNLETRLREAVEAGKMSQAVADAKLLIQADKRAKMQERAQALGRWLDGEEEVLPGTEKKHPFQYETKFTNGTQVAPMSRLVVDAVAETVETDGWLRTLGGYFKEYAGELGMTEKMPHEDGGLAEEDPFFGADMGPAAWEEDPAAWEADPAAWEADPAAWKQGDEEPVVINALTVGEAEQQRRLQAMFDPDSNSTGTTTTSSAVGTGTSTTTVPPLSYDPTWSTTMGPSSSENATWSSTAAPAPGPWDGEGMENKMRLHKFGRLLAKQCERRAHKKMLRKKMRLSMSVPEDFTAAEISGLGQDASFEGAFCQSLVSAVSERRLLQEVTTAAPAFPILNGTALPLIQEFAPDAQEEEDFLMMEDEEEQTGVDDVAPTVEDCQVLGVDSVGRRRMAGLFGRRRQLESKEVEVSVEYELASLDPALEQKMEDPAFRGRMRSGMQEGAGEGAEAQQRWSVREVHSVETQSGDTSSGYTTGTVIELNGERGQSGNDSARGHREDDEGGAHQEVVIIGAVLVALFLCFVIGWRCLRRKAAGSNGRKQEARKAPPQKTAAANVPFGQQQQQQQPAQKKSTSPSESAKSSKPNHQSTRYYYINWGNNGESNNRRQVSPVAPPAAPPVAAAQYPMLPPQHQTLHYPPQPFPAVYNPHPQPPPQQATAPMYQPPQQQAGAPTQLVLV